MRIVVAMDSFKDCLTAVQACSIVAEAIGSDLPNCEIIAKPMADGGEGTAAAMIAAGNGQWIKEPVMGPLPNMHVDAGFAWFAEEKTGLVEMASASGLELLGPDSRNPLKTTTYGTGQLIAAAIKHGAKQVLLAIGGSATVDGGTGAATALGWQFLDDKGNAIGLGGGELCRIEKIVPPPQPIDASVEVLCDVNNPLCGEHGAARVYGPQKGATEEMVELLEAGLAHLAAVVKEQIKVDIKDVPGAGAAGGLGAGAVAFIGARVVSGIETVMSHSGMDEAITNADWVITGEGRFDHQSLRGKVVSGIVQLAQRTGAQVAVLAGQILLKPVQYREFGVAEAIACMDNKMTLDYAIKNGQKLLAQAAKRFVIAHLTSRGGLDRPS